MVAPNLHTSGLRPRLPRPGHSHDRSADRRFSDHRRRRRLDRRELHDRKRGAIGSRMYRERELHGPKRCCPLCCSPRSPCQSDRFEKRRSLFDVCRDDYARSRSMKTREAVPKLAIISVCLNDERVLPGFLSNMREWDNKEFRFILVDNGSRDSSLELVRRGRPDVMIVQLNENLGTTGAYNHGIRCAREMGSQYVQFLALDVLSAPDCLKGPRRGDRSESRCRGDRPRSVQIA